MAPGKPLPAKGLYAITNCMNLTTGQLLKKTAQILQAGAVMLQYRNKDADPPLRLHQASRLQKLCDQYGIPFIINDDPELARALRADGVHLGREDTECRNARIMLDPESIIGVSCYNEIERALAAEKSGASYIAFGAFFRSNTKPDAVKAIPELIKKAKQTINLPVVAIGGITPENGGGLVNAGADFLAVSSGLYANADTYNITKKYLALFNDVK